MEIVDQLLESDNESIEEPQKIIEKDERKEISVDNIEDMSEEKIIVTKKKEISEKKRKSLAKARATKKARAVAKKLLEKQENERWENYTKIGVYSLIGGAILGGIYYINHQNFSLPSFLKKSESIPETKREFQIKEQIIVDPQKKPIIKKPVAKPVIAELPKPVKNIVKKLVEKIEKPIPVKEPENVEEYIPFG
jgi:hypothetical protein